MPKDMNKALRDAALLRNNIEGVLRAAPAPMTGREIADWDPIKAYIETGSASYSRLSGQLSRLKKENKIEVIGSGPTTTYRWLNDQPQILAVNKALRVVINKDGSITVKIKDVSITIEIQ